MRLWPAWKLPIAYLAAPSPTSRTPPNPPYLPSVRDFADWKRKNAVPPKAQVFAMTGWYPCVKQALLDRGWFYNPDATSPYFDLKWTLRSIDVAQVCRVLSCISRKGPC